MKYDDSTHSIKIIIFDLYNGILVYSFKLGLRL